MSDPYYERSGRAIMAYLREAGGRARIRAADVGVDARDFEPALRRLRDNRRIKRVGKEWEVVE